MSISDRSASSDQSASAMAWYKPERWPEWLRWIAILPSATMVAIVFHFAHMVLNSVLGSFGPSAVVAAFASAAAAAVFVLAGAWIAPKSPGLVALTLAIVVVLWAACAIGQIQTGSYRGTQPLGYDVLGYCLAVLGAVCAVLPAREFTKRQRSAVPGSAHEIVRWTLCLPAGFAAAVIAGVTVASPYVILDSQLPAVIELENAFLQPLILIATASAVAPRGRRYIAFVLGSLWSLFGLLRICAAVWAVISGDRQFHGYQWILTDSPWYSVLLGFAAIAGGTIPVVGADSWSLHRSVFHWSGSSHNRLTDN